jgi:hypothetical protein
MRWREEYETDRLEPLTLPLAYEPSDHLTHDLARVSDLMLKIAELEGELRAVDQALLVEQTPLLSDTGERLPRYGRIRFLGDRARRAEHKADA